MTAAQLALLAEHAASAAGYYADIDPSNARRFAEVALVAVKLSAELACEEHFAGRESRDASWSHPPDAPSDNFDGFTDLLSHDSDALEDDVVRRFDLTQQQGSAVCGIRLQYSDGAKVDRVVVTGT